MIYLLDTNILSELMRPKPNQHVINWVDKQLISNLYISSITIAEIQLGIALLPTGKRKNTLIDAANDVLQYFHKYQLNFDGIAAYKYAEIVANCTKIGRPISVEDAQIASIAHVYNATLVTRNTSDFEMIDELKIYNPF